MEGLLNWTDQPDQHASLLYEQDCNHVVFQLAGKEVLRIKRDGDVLVHGRLCGNDAEIFEAVQRFFKTAFGPTFGAAGR